MIEKRSSRRHVRQLNVKYGLEQPVSPGFTDDLSAAGMFIRTHDVLRPGSVIFAEVCLPDNTRILLKGCVMWRKEFPPALVRQVKRSGMGIKILEILSGKEYLSKATVTPIKMII